MTEKTNPFLRDDYIQHDIDDRHELLIKTATLLLTDTLDKRYWPILKQLISMRSPAQIERMERAQGLDGA